MNTRQFLMKIAELFLQSEEGTRDWVSVPRLRHTWYALCGFVLVYMLVSIFSEAFFGSILTTSARATLIYRIIMLTLVVSAQACIFVLGLRYYQFSLSQRAALRLDNIVTLYALTTLFFGYIYYHLFVVVPSCFIYHDPPTLIGPYVNRDTWLLFRMKMEFVLFSAFESVNGSFYKIQAHSLYVSILIYIQSLSTIALIGLFIALYVNRRSQQPRAGR